MMAIHLLFFLINVVGEYGAPAPLVQPHSHEANTRKVFGNGE